MTIASHTICKNSMPFIGRVLRQVAPYMDKMFITISQHSTDGTHEEVMKFISETKTLVEFAYEGETNPANLTRVRQFQVDHTKQDWILFLDDDDYWPRGELEACLKELDREPEVLAYSVSPYQLIDFEHYDASWNKKSFSKFLRTAGLRYAGPWPRDLPCDAQGQPLYWKTHPQVRTLPQRFYHLGLLKHHSFRKEDWAKKFAYKVGRPEKLTEPFQL